MNPCYWRMNVSNTYTRHEDILTDHGGESRSERAQQSVPRITLGALISACEKGSLPQAVKESPKWRKQSASSDDCN